MPAPLSLDFRRRIFDAAAAASAATVAARFGVSRTTVHRLRKSHRDTGALDPKPPRPGPAPVLTDGDKAVFERYLAENTSLRQQDMAARFAAESGRPVSRQAVQRALARWRITRKKS